MSERNKPRQSKIAMLQGRLAYHLRLLREDASDPALTSLERLALIRDRAKRIREIRRELFTTKERVSQGPMGVERQKANKRVGGLETRGAAQDELVARAIPF